MGRQRTRGTGSARLGASPTVPTLSVEPGLHRLALSTGSEAVLRVPVGHSPGRPAPLVLSLHGAGGSADSGLYPLAELADEAGLVLLAPSSAGSTWDAIRGGYGPDVETVDAALADAFARCAVDPDRLAVAGFSDGASYALGLGLTNGDLFRHVLAFSPGFVTGTDPRGEPHVFVSHGVEDRVLPIERCSRRLVPALRDAGYAVTYHEFDGPHEAPPEVARAAVAGLLDRRT